MSYPNARNTTCFSSVTRAYWKCPSQSSYSSGRTFLWWMYLVFLMHLWHATKHLTLCIFFHETKVSNLQKYNYNMITHPTAMAERWRFLQSEHNNPGNNCKSPSRANLLKRFNHLISGQWGETRWQNGKGSDNKAAKSRYHLPDVKKESDRNHSCMPSKPY